MSNPLDDEPYICPVCETTGGPDCRKYGGRCEPFAVIVVGEQFKPDPERPEWDEPTRSYCIEGRWYSLLPTMVHDIDHDLPEAWGLPLVEDGEAIASNFDRLVRLAEVGRPNIPRPPVRQYAADTARFYADKWARALGCRVVLTGNDGGREVS